MALRRYQHKFPQPLEIDQERVASSVNTSITATNLTVTNSTVTNQTISKLSTSNFFNSATPDYTPSFEALAIIADPNVSQGAIAHIRNNNVSVNDANVFGGLKFSSSPGADFIIGKSTQSGNGFLQVRRENGTTLATMDGFGNLNLSAGNLGIGIDAIVKFHVSGTLWNNNGGGDAIISNSNTVGSSLTFRPTNSATYASGWSLYAGASGALIGDGSFGFWNHTAANAPFYVKQNGDSVITGNLIVSPTKGIDFSAGANAAGMTSELLADYEEGTWTPAITDGYTRTYGNRYGRYVKIGSYVYVFGQINLSGRSGSPGSYAYITLPFQANGMGQIQQPLSICSTYGFTHTSIITVAAQWDAPTELRIYETTANANANYLSPSGIPASGEIGFYYVFYTAS